jgi:hypothetical protein
LKVGGAMSGLRRTCIASGGAAFTVDNAYTLDALCSMPDRERLQCCLRPLLEAVSNWPRLTVDAVGEKLLRNGHVLSVARIIQDGALQPVKVFASRE